MHALKSAIRAFFDALEDALNTIVPPGCNPLAQLGAIGWFLFWIVAGSGIYLYVFLDTGVVRAYQSIESITHGQPWVGGVLRSAHRYASDALVIVAGVHLLREFSLDRMRGRRWFAWLTGLPLVMFLYVCGLTGYWMVWDRLAQYVATTSARWLDALGIFGEPISHNFVSNASVSSRFFTLIVYLHIAAPLLMLLFMWIHIQRHNHARVNPPRPLMIAIGLGLMLLAVFMPAVSQAPADLDHLASSVAIDWFYLPLFPLTDRLGAPNLWLLLAGAGLLLALLPWAPPARTRAVAKVHLDNCNGCSRCFADCPFTAITMRPRSDGAPYAEEAVVDASLCVSCGICVGACPTATPFRRASELVPGIELPDFLLARLRERIASARASSAAPLRAIVFRCEHGAARAAEDPAAALVVDVPCLGMIPPPFLDFIIHERLAEGVLLAGCRHDDCHERLGIRWTEERLAGLRDPALRSRVPRERLGLSYAGKGQERARRRSLAAFFAHLELLPPGAQSKPDATQKPWMSASRRLPRPVGWIAQLAGLVAAACGIAALAAGPSVRLLAPDQAVITLSLTHAAKRIEDCKAPSAADQASRQPNMRRAACPRRRWPMTIDIEVDGRPVYTATAPPAGLWGDGASSVFHQFKVGAGERQVTIRMRDSGRGSGYDFATTRVARLAPGQNLVIGFTDEDRFSFD